MTIVPTQTTPASPLPVLPPPPFLAGLASGGTNSAQLASLATKYPKIFAKARQETPALQVLPADITTYEELKARALAVNQSKPVTHGIFTAKVGREIKALFHNETWTVPFDTMLGGLCGWASGWFLGGSLGASLGQVLDKPLFIMGGDTLSCITLPILAYFSARREHFTANLESSDVPFNASHDKALKTLSPLTALAMGATFFATRSYEGPEYVMAAATLSIFAAFGASIIGSLVVPPILQKVDNIKAHFNHWNEARTLNKALRAFEKRLGALAEVAG